MFSKSDLYSVERPSFYALILADTDDDKAGVGIAADALHMEQMCHVIAKEIGYELKLTKMQGKEATVDNLKSWFYRVPPSLQNIVFFFYTGHGSRDPLEQPWPVFYLTHSSGVSGNSIVDFLRQHQQRLGVILFNCCNMDFAWFPYERLHKGFDDLIDGQKSLPGLKSLFLKTEGLVIATSSKPGEYSYTNTKNYADYFGGIFTTGLLKELQKGCIQREITWDQVFQRTERYCAENLNPQRFQHPFYQIEKKYPAAKDRSNEQKQAVPDFALPEKRKEEKKHRKKKKRKQLSCF